MLPWKTLSETYRSVQGKGIMRAPTDREIKFMKSCIGIKRKTDPADRNLYLVEGEELGLWKNLEHMGLARREDQEYLYNGPLFRLTRAGIDVTMEAIGRITKTEVLPSDDVHEDSNELENIVWG